jgi:hypothetical protein
MRVYHEEQFGPIVLGHDFLMIKSLNDTWVYYGQQVSLFGRDIIPLQLIDSLGKFSM